MRRRSERIPTEGREPWGWLSLLREIPTRHPVIFGSIFAVIVLSALMVILAVTGVGPSEPVLIQSISSAGLVLSVAVPILLSARRKAAQTAADVAAVKHEVKNDHNTNLRIENDERHELILGRLDASDQAQGAILVALQEIRSDIRGIRKDGGRREDRIIRLEGAVFAVARGQTEDEALGDLADSVTKRRDAAEKEADE